MKPGLKRGAGEATSRRLDLLETQLREHQARIYHLEQQQQMANMQSLTAPPTTSPASVVAPAGPSVSSAFDLAAFSQSIQQAPHPPPPVSSMSIQPSPGVVSHHSDPANSPHTTIRGGEESSVLDSLPAAVVQSLLDLYQAHLGPTLPLFSPNMSFTWPWTLPAFAMVAAALRLPQATRLLAQPEQIRLACRRHVIATATETTTVETLQALTIIVQDTIASGAEPCTCRSLPLCSPFLCDLTRTCSCNRKPANWGTLALLTRSIRHLGLVDCLVDNSAEKGRLRLLPKATTPQEAESHRRLFWCTWMLDRFSCASTGWCAHPPIFPQRAARCPSRLLAGSPWYFILGTWQFHTRKLSWSFPRYIHRILFRCQFLVPTVRADKTTPFSQGDHIWTAAQPLPAPVFVSVPLGGNMDMTGLHEFAHLIRVVDMLGRVAVHQSNHPMVLDETNTQAVQDRAHDGRVLLNALETAQQCIPRAFTEAAAMGTATPLQYQVIGTYHTTVLKLCASLAYPVGRSGPAQEPFCERLRASTAAAGRLAIAILRAGRVHDMSPMMAWCLWVSARISFVDSYMNNKEPSAEFNAVLDLLQAMSNTWAVAGPSFSVLMTNSLTPRLLLTMSADRLG